MCDYSDLDLVAAYMEGATLEQVGERFGISWRTVHRRIRKVAPWIMRPRGNTRRADPTERERRIFEMRRAGMSLHMIGDLEGISRQRVHAILKRWRYTE